MKKLITTGLLLTIFMLVTVCFSIMTIQALINGELNTGGGGRHPSPAKIIKRSDEPRAYWISTLICLGTSLFGFGFTVLVVRNRSKTQGAKQIANMTAEFGLYEVRFTASSGQTRSLSYADHPEVFGYPRFLIADHEQSDALIRATLRALSPQWFVLRSLRHTVAE
jgi:hypothetical protein